MTIQDCWVAFEKRHVQDAVRSLMRKMNIKIVELEENINMGGKKGIHLLELLFPEE